MTMPASLVPLLRLRARRAIVVGDPKQLPPILASGSKSPLRETLFVRLARAADVVGVGAGAAERGAARWSVVHFFCSPFFCCAHQMFSRFSPLLLFFVPSSSSSSSRQRHRRPQDAVPLPPRAGLTRGVPVLPNSWVEERDLRRGAKLRVATDRAPAGVGRRARRRAPPRRRKLQQPRRSARRGVPRSPLASLRRRGARRRHLLVPRAGERGATPARECRRRRAAPRAAGGRRALRVARCDRRRGRRRRGADAGHRDARAPRRGGQSEHRRCVPR